jgi:COMPASS component SWD2
MTSISHEDISNLSSSQVFVLDPSQINSLDFFHNGEHLVAANDEGTVLLIDPLEGRVVNKFYAKKFGIANVCWTHHPTAIVGSSTLNKFDCSIRYLSLHDNTYLREYKGHTDVVNSLAVSPIDDTMLSASWDRTIRQWDLRAPNCVGILENQGFSHRIRHHVAFDHDGLIFGSSTGSQCVKLFDLKNLSKGPFATFVLEENNDFITSIVFSDNGKYIALGTEGATVYLLDAFNGFVVNRFDIKNDHRCTLGLCFTPDTNYLLAGCEDGSVVGWNLKDNFKKILFLEEIHAGPVSCLRWNPLYNQCASACSNVAILQPRR